MLGVMNVSDTPTEQHDIPVEDVARQSELVQPRLFGHGSVELRLIRVVSLSWLHESWTVVRFYEDEGEGACGVLRHLKWSPPKKGSWTLKCAGDPQRTDREYIPDIHTSIVDCDLDLDDLFPWIARLADVRVPLAGFTELRGLDGETHELIIPRSLEEIRFRWWCEGPPEWKPLTSLAQDFLLWSAKKIKDANPGILRRFFGKK